MLSSSSSAMFGSFGFPWGFQASSCFDSEKESEINHVIYAPKTSLEPLALIVMLFFLCVRRLCNSGRDPEQDIPGDQEHHEDGHGHVPLRGGRALGHQNHRRDKHPAHSPRYQTHSRNRRGCGLQSPNSATLGGLKP